MTAHDVPAAAREEYGGRWSWLFVLGLAIERAGRTFTTWQRRAWKVLDGGAA